MKIVDNSNYLFESHLDEFQGWKRDENDDQQSLGNISHVNNGYRSINKCSFTIL